MRKIVQIEELRYGRRESYDEAALDEMIECFKGNFDNEIPQTSLSPFYPLIERTLYQFDDGKLTGSKRTLYLLGQEIRDQKYVEWYPDWNREAPTVFYDAKRDEYVVRHIRYKVDKSTPRFISQALAEADCPRKSKDIQAPPETPTTAPLSAPKAQPAPQPKPEPTPTPSFTSTEYHKPWRQKTLSELRRLYNAGKSLKEIASIMGKFEVSIVYQLKTYLGVEHPFEKAPQQPVSKPQSRTQSKPQPPTSMNGIEYYKDLFHNMRRAKNEFGELAPHKIILMLAVLQVLKYPSFPFKKDLRLQVAFMDNWQKHVKSSHWTPNLNMPWEHMPSEPFWQGEPNSREASVDPQLQKLIMNKDTRKELKASLISLL